MRKGPWPVVNQLVEKASVVVYSWHMRCSEAVKAQALREGRGTGWPSAQPVHPA